MELQTVRACPCRARLIPRSCMQPVSVRIVRGVLPAPAERPVSPSDAAASEPDQLVHRPDVQPLAAAALLRALPSSVTRLEVRSTRRAAVPITSSSCVGFAAGTQPLSSA